jgi:hypothetical protein
VWGFAATAISLKTAYFDSMPATLGLSLYLGMGWIGAYTGLSVWRRFGYSFMAPILWGGVAYSIGAVLEFLRWPILVPGVVQWHEVFHVAVLIGLGFHWSFIYAIADGRLGPCGSRPPMLPETCPAPEVCCDSKSHKEVAGDSSDSPTSAPVGKFDDVSSIAEPCSAPTAER